MNIDWEYILNVALTIVIASSIIAIEITIVVLIVKAVEKVIKKGKK